MIIEYDSKDFKVLEEKKIKNTSYRIVGYDTGYCSLQVKPFGDMEYEDFIISPQKTNTSISEDITIGDEKGYYDLMKVLSAIEDSVKLQNGEYWSLELTIFQDGKKSNTLTEIISREDGEQLIDKMSQLSELIEEAELYGDYDETVDLLDLVFRGICLIILIVAIVLIVLRLTGGV